MKLIVGLGNPTKEHEKQRHNIGFMAIDSLVREYNLSGPKQKFAAEIYEGFIGTEKVLAIKPQTYMNNSGRAVAEAAKFYKIGLDNIIVVYDELDLAFSKLRIKQGGGAGGHNGIRDIDAKLGKKNYFRIRMGIDHPGHKDRVTGYVLSNFSKEEAPIVEEWCDDFARYIALLWEESAEALMTKMALMRD